MEVSLISQSQIKDKTDPIDEEVQKDHTSAEILQGQNLKGSQSLKEKYLSKLQHESMFKFSQVITHICWIIDKVLSASRSLRVYHGLIYF